jgi:hypothetical protein
MKIEFQEENKGPKGMLIFKIIFILFNENLI